MNSDTIQNLFNHMSREHNLTLLVSELEDIASIFDKENNNTIDTKIICPGCDGSGGAGHNCACCNGGGLVDVKVFNQTYYLQVIEDAISSAVIRVDRTKLRRYLRNWVTELIRQEKSKAPSIRVPKK
jgi:hypothetical protein